MHKIIFYFVYNKINKDKDGAGVKAWVGRMDIFEKNKEFENDGK